MLTSLLGSRLNQANHRFLQFANHRGDGGNCWLYNRSSSSAEGNLFKFFIKPRLKISYDANSNTEEEDKRWGTVRDRKVRNAWKERVENPEVINLYNAVLRNLPGRAVARNSEVKILVLENSDGCKALAIREKSLVWEDGESKIDIGVRSRKIFHLAFSQQRLTDDHEWMMGKVYCGVEKKKVEPKAWIGTKRALEDQIYGKDDGMCHG